MEILPLLTHVPGVSAFSTLAGFNTCTYAGAPADQTAADMRRLEQLIGLPASRIILPLQSHSARIAIIPTGSEGTPTGSEGVPTGSEGVPTGSEGVPPSHSNNSNNSNNSDNSNNSEPADPADGVAARGRNIALGVHTADCLPLLMVDPPAQVIAAVHCGWRGTVAGIATNAVNAMISLGADPARIVAAFGPHICPRCFEVGPEVAAQFPPETVIPSDRSNPHVDLAAAVALQLRRAGVTHIHPSPCCSKTDPRLYSVRRQGHALTHRTLTLIRLTAQPWE